MPSVWRRRCFETNHKSSAVAHQVTPMPSLLLLAPQLFRESAFYIGMPLYVTTSCKNVIFVPACIILNKTLRQKVDIFCCFCLSEESLVYIRSHGATCESVARHRLTCDDACVDRPRVFSTFVCNKAQYSRPNITPERSRKACIEKTMRVLV